MLIFKSLPCVYWKTKNIQITKAINKFREKFKIEYQAKYYGLREKSNDLRQNSFLIFHSY